MVPALAGTALVVLAALLARELGGGWRAQALAALCVIAKPLFLRSANLFQPVVLDQLTWTLALLALARLLGGYGPGSWLVLGLALGLGLLVKFSIGVIGVAIARRHSAQPAPPRPADTLALGGAAARLRDRIAHPGRPDPARHSRPGPAGRPGATQLERVTPLDFLFGQILWGPSTLLALAGRPASSGRTGWRRFAGLGIACLTAFALLTGPARKGLLHRSDLPDAVRRRRGQVEALGESTTAEFVNWGDGDGPRRLRAADLTPRPALPVAAAHGMLRAAVWGFTEAVRTNTGELGELPQDYADMIGWKQQAEAVGGCTKAFRPTSGPRR